MNIQIHKIDQNSLNQINQCDNSFLVERQWRLYTRDDDIYYTLAPGANF